MLESGSTSKGRLSEEQVLNHYLNQGYQFYCRNQKIAGVEVDLVFYKKAWFLIEVKTLRSHDEAHFRLHLKQQKRLLWARQFWQEHRGEDVILRVVFVTPEEIIDLAIEDLIS